MTGKKNTNVTDDTWKSYRETRDISTRNFIMIEYMYIVKYIAIRMYSTYKNHAEQDDIISCGSLALLNAVERFDPGRDIKFETFASIKIRGAMIDYLRQQDWVPRTLRKNVKDMDAAYTELQNKLGRTPTDEEISGKLGINIEEYHETLGKSYTANIFSIEEMLADNMANMMPATNNTPENQIEENELTEVLSQAIDSLSEKERIIISLCYYENLKAKNIAVILEISESRVSQLHSKALMKLKYCIAKYFEL